MPRSSSRSITTHSKRESSKRTRSESAPTGGRANKWSHNRTISISYYTSYIQITAFFCAPSQHWFSVQVKNCVSKNQQKRPTKQQRRKIIISYFRWGLFEFIKSHRCSGESEVCAIVPVCTRATIPSPHIPPRYCTLLFFTSQTNRVSSLIHISFCFFFPPSDCSAIKAPEKNIFIKPGDSLCGA